MHIIEDPPMEWEWADEGKFAKENQVDHPAMVEDDRIRREVELEDAGPLVRNTHLFTSHYNKRRYTQQRVNNGDYVAVDVRDRHENEDDVLRFFIGAVLSFDRNAITCKVRWYNSSTGEFGKYKKYNGQGEKVGTVRFFDLLCRFEGFTSLKNLYKKDRKAIEAQLAVLPNQRVPLILTDE